MFYLHGRMSWLTCVAAGVCTTECVNSLKDSHASDENADCLCSALFPAFVGLYMGVCHDLHLVFVRVHPSKDCHLGSPNK